MCKWKEKSEHRLVLCGLDRPTHSGVKAVETKENKKNQASSKNKFHGKFENYSEVRTFEEDTAAERKPHHGS